MGDDEDSPTSPEWRRFRVYQLEVDPHQDDKSKEIQLCDFSRPHMRAFHCSWWAFFIAFFIWFAITPLLPDIQDTLNLTDTDIARSSIAGVGGTIIVRFILGPLCDVYGARILFAIVLCGVAIPAACTGFVQTANGLIIIRSFIGLAGGTFVMCQYWTSRMFCKEVVGTANAIVGGWGNIGASVTHIVIGSLLYPFFKDVFNGDMEKAWRFVTIIPAVIAFATGVMIYFYSDDSPKGNYDELKKRNVLVNKVSAGESFCEAGCDLNTWILFIQYACCFGVELTMNSAAATYFRDVHGMSHDSSLAIASIFGWMNLFARGLGGVFSDAMNETMGMKGRLVIHSILLFMEGILVLVFGNTGSLASSVIVLVFFSLAVQAAEGTTYGIVPYVQPPFTGSVSGIVGAGGNLGAVCFGFAFLSFGSQGAYIIMSISVIISSFLTVLIQIKGHRGLLCGDDLEVDKETGEVFDDTKFNNNQPYV